MTYRRLQVRPTRGFTLVEVLVSMTILSIGVMVLGGLLGRGARNAGAASAVSYQTAMLAAEAARLDAMPFTLLPAAGTVCDTSTALPLPRIRCITLTNINPKLRRVSVVITPTDNPLLQPDSIAFERSISGDASPPLFTP
jgi:prepilin-type N-terminal cleavage/methylation domain-containing protein